MGSQGREDVWQVRLEDQTRQSHISMQRNREEQLVSDTDCATQGSSAGK